MSGCLSICSSTTSTTHCSCWKLPSTIRLAEAMNTHNKGKNTIHSSQQQQQQPQPTGPPSYSNQQQSRQNAPFHFEDASQSKCFFRRFIHSITISCAMSEKWYSTWNGDSIRQPCVLHSRLWGERYCWNSFQGNVYYIKCYSGQMTLQLVRDWIWGGKLVCTWPARDDLDHGHGPTCQDGRTTLSGIGSAHLERWPVDLSFFVCCQSYLLNKC